MNCDTNTAIGIPGKSYSFSLGVAPRSDTKKEQIGCATSHVSFADYKNLLSDRPLRRPNRNRPID